MVHDADSGRWAASPPRSASNWPDCRARALPALLSLTCAGAVKNADGAEFLATVRELLHHPRRLMR
ncbi:hypothetical protein [Amycolatopsis sp. NPDC051372]|uniref:hypothetical protein n=1 Tax=unclassified Amycolatopsis TaxID=2618356 RepID=UPI0034199F41